MTGDYARRPRLVKDVDRRRLRTRSWGRHHHYKIKLGNSLMESSRWVQAGTIHADCASEGASRRDKPLRRYRDRGLEAPTDQSRRPASDRRFHQEGPRRDSGDVGSLESHPANVGSEKITGLQPRSRLPTRLAWTALKKSPPGTGEASCGARMLLSAAGLFFSSLKRIAPSRVVSNVVPNRGRCPPGRTSETL
jgi:hypothetical protein